MRTKLLYVHHAYKESNIKKKFPKERAIELLSSLESYILILVNLYKHEHIWVVNISSHLLMIYSGIVKSVSLGINLKHLIKKISMKTLQRSKPIIKLRFYDLSVQERINLMSSVPFVNNKVFKDNLQLVIHLNKTVYQNGKMELQ